MAAFAGFGSDLDKATQEQLANGERQTEMLKQPQYSPLNMEEQVVTIFAASPQGERDSWIRKYELADVGRYEEEMLAFIRSSHQDILDVIASSEKFEEETEQKLIAALDEFANIFQPSRGGSEEEAA
jgi:F-type H+-transporting ATPase subunit alpha